MNPAYRPMLATLVDEPFDDKKWVFETKWDGFRLVTEKRGNIVRLWSRNGIDVTSRYAVLLPALQKIEGSCVIDGEICALDAQGRSRFQLLQNALNKKAKLLYVVFDALFVGDNDIRQKPLLERKELLKALLPREPLLRYSQHVAEFGKREFAKAQRAHEEGVIAKRAAGLYYSGKRTREWLKFKAVHEQEVVIVGYTEPRRSRKYFGSLVLAVRDKGWLPPYHREAGRYCGTLSRNGIDVTSRYAVLLPALQKVEGSYVIDGEICALDAQGRSRFQLLQNTLNKKAKLLYVVFDVPFSGDKDIREKPLLERKRTFESSVAARIRCCASANTSPSLVHGIRQGAASARGGPDRQARCGTLLLGQAHARMAQVQGGA